jgi:nitrogen fixation protein NifU and related proteins
LYQEVILDHSRRPRNRGELGEGAVHVHGDNPSCGDELDLWVRISEDGRIDDIKFSGHGCAISQASASMMTTRVKGRPCTEAAGLAGAMHTLLTDTTAPAPADVLGDLQLLQGVRQFPQRVKCAALGWRALEEALRLHAANRSSGSATTEDGDSL